MLDCNLPLKCLKAQQKNPRNTGFIGRLCLHMRSTTHTYSQCLHPGVLPADRACTYRPLLRPGMQWKAVGDKMRHKQVDGCSLFSALASAVSLNLCHLLRSSHRLLPAHTHSPHAHTALEELVTRVSPITDTAYVCTYTHSHFTQQVGEQQRHLPKRVFHGSRMSHYARLRHTGTQTTHTGTLAHTQTQTNKLG